MSWHREWSRFLAVSLTLCLLGCGHRLSTKPPISALEKTAADPRLDLGARVDALVALGHRTDEVPLSFFVGLYNQEHGKHLGLVALVYIAGSFEHGAPYAKNAPELKALCRPLINLPVPDVSAVKIEGYLKDEWAVPTIAKYFVEKQVSLGSCKEVQLALKEIGSPAALRALTGQRELFKSMGSRKLKRNLAPPKTHPSSSEIDKARDSIYSRRCSAADLKLVGDAKDVASLPAIKSLLIGPVTDKIIIATQDALASIGSDESWWVLRQLDGQLLSLAN